MVTAPAALPVLAVWMLVGVQQIGLMHVRVGVLAIVGAVSGRIAL